MGVFFTLFYQPVLNLFIGIMSVLGTTVAWTAIFLLVVVVKLLFLPFAVKTAKMQVVMQGLQPRLKELQKNKGMTQEERAKTMLALYREHKVNPFFPLLSLLIQIPIFLTLFFVIKDVGEQSLPLEAVYSFLTSPPFFNNTFLATNLFENGGIVFALLIGVSQWALLYIMQLHTPPTSQTRGLQKVLLIALPLAGIGAGFFLNVAVGLYWFFNNTLSILQEVLVLRSIRLGVVPKESSQSC